MKNKSDSIKQKLFIFIRKFFVTANASEYLYHRKKYFESNGLMRMYHNFYCEKIMDEHNAFLPLNMSIQGKITFPHGLNGICISQGAVLGDNTTIFQQVTIGSNNLEDTKKAGSPIIGNNVYIGVGAKIIGNVTVGNNVRIGANCVVVTDIPDNCTVVLNKPRIILHDRIKDNTFTALKADNFKIEDR